MILTRRTLLKSLAAVAGAAAVGLSLEAIAAAPPPAVALPWLPCDGRAYDPKLYPELADLLGEVFGATVPDARGGVLCPVADGAAAHYWIRATPSRDDMAAPVGTICLVINEPHVVRSA